MEFFKKNKNELLKILVLTIFTILIFVFTKYRLKNEILWPYEKNTRLILIMFAFVFFEYTIYFAMNKYDSFVCLLYKLLPAVVLVMVLLFIPQRLFKIIPFLLPLVIIYINYGILNTIAFQTFITILYYLTGYMSAEILILYMFSFIIVFFIAEYANSHLSSALVFIMSVMSFFVLNIDYQYMTYEKISISKSLICMVPFIVSIIPLYFRYIFIKMKDLRLKKSLKNLCDDENELMVIFREKNEEAYFHSLQVSDVSVRVAKMIGANTSLVKAGARFHEIGRLKSENYISAGVEIMKKNGCPEEVIKIIREHNSKSNIPKSLESAIVMLSDSIETTINTIAETKGTEFNRRKIVENIIDIRFNSGMLDDSIKDIALYKKLRKAYVMIYS